jgi:hypothetical protein
MATITVQLDDLHTTPRRYRATLGDRHALGATVGEALDGLTPDLESETSLVVIRSTKPDRYFTAAQQQRLADLMARWRAARDAGSEFPSADQTELESLVVAELRGATDRAAALACQVP